MNQISEQAILAALSNIIDPDLRKDIVTLGFIKDLAITDGGEVSFRIVLTTPACPVKEAFEEDARRLVGGIEGVTAVKVIMDAEVPKGRGVAGNMALPNVKNIIAVSSGKGGVGKSTVAVNLAVSLALDGAKVGLMDADVYGPNVPLMLGVAQQQPAIFNNKIIPIEAHVDMPPGTGDVQLSLAQLVPVQGAVLVTTPQSVSIADVLRALKMFETVAVPLLGIIENMSYFVPPDMPEKRYNIFGEGGGRKLADDYNAPFLGEIPLGMEVREAGDAGTPVVISNPESPQAIAFRRVAEEVARYISIEAMKPELIITSRAKS